MKLSKSNKYKMVFREGLMLKTVFVDRH